MKSSLFFSLERLDKQRKKLPEIKEHKVDFYPEVHPSDYHFLTAAQGIMNGDNYSQFYSSGMPHVKYSVGDFSEGQSTC